MSNTPDSGLEEFRFNSIIEKISTIQDDVKDIKCSQDECKAIFTSAISEIHVTEARIQERLSTGSKHFIEIDRKLDSKVDAKVITTVVACCSVIAGILGWVGSMLIGWIK